MAVIINASTSTGLVQSADTSGIIQFQSNGSTKATLNSSGFSYPGAVLQVVSTTKTSQFTSNSTSPIDITGLSTSITPSSTSNKILITANISYTSSDYSNGGFPNVYFTLNDGSNNVIVQGDTLGTRKRGVANGITFYSAGQVVNQPINYLWSPSTTSSVTVKLRGAASSGSFSVCATWNEDNQGGYGNFSGISTITLMEIAG